MTIYRNLKTPFQVLKRTVLSDDPGGSEKVIYIPSETLYGVLTRSSTSDVVQANSNVLERQKNLRVFTAIDVAYNDRILIQGEQWRIIGEPETVRSPGNRRKLSTLIVIEKEGVK